MYKRISIIIVIIGLLVSFGAGARAASMDLEVMDTPDERALLQVLIEDLDERIQSNPNMMTAGGVFNDLKYLRDEKSLSFETQVIDYVKAAMDIAAAYDTWKVTHYLHLYKTTGDIKYLSEMYGSLLDLLISIAGSPISMGTMWWAAQKFVMDYGDDGELVYKTMGGGEIVHSNKDGWLTSFYQSVIQSWDMICTYIQTLSWKPPSERQWKWDEFFYFNVQAQMQR